MLMYLRQRDGGAPGSKMLSPKAAPLSQTAPTNSTVPSANSILRNQGFISLRVIATEFTGTITVPDPCGPSTPTSTLYAPDSMNHSVVENKLVSPRTRSATSGGGAPLRPVR